MKIEEYSKLAIRTANLENSPLVHAAMGIGGEAGEVVDVVKKMAFYGKTGSEQHLLEELGDLAWYMNLMIVALGSNWNKVLDMNIAKLEARYKDGKFNAEQAINRDKEGEAAAMAGVK